MASKMSITFSEDEEEEIEIKQIKMIFIGDSAVGKTSIIQRFTQNRFDSEQKYKQTIGLDFFMKEVEITASLHASLQCWDIGGQTIGQKMIKSYLRGSHAIFFVYDVTDAKTFENLEKWMEFVKEVIKETGKVPYLALIGNKTDLGYQRVISIQQNQAFADQYGMRFFYVSARTGDNVHATILKVANDLCGVHTSSTDVEIQAAAPAVATIKRSPMKNRTNPEMVEAEIVHDKKAEKDDCIIF
ncbi:putative GTP-binding protein yptV2 [Blattamonas nauphoetae]|uniref:GTP-binding protein yptV2 n=1 Tax=Blattamonas nauphoetae TaxID=2049346 RepID=A0ABQ9XH18_9EUKA|nr:putative GTP-binding protein yptV2 [Blattamonas nauphoetae]